MLNQTDHGDGICELQLDHPPVNALNADLLAALTDAVQGAPDAGHRALIISGRQGLFSAGLDVPFLLDLPRAALSKFWDQFGLMLKTLACSEIPVVAALTGHAPAGGTVLAAFCDYRVMAQGNYSMGFIEAQVGLPVPPGVYAAFERLCGPRIAGQYSVEGRMFDGAHGHEIGLVDELVSAEQVIPAAVAWCKKILALPAANSVALTRRTARGALQSALDAGVIDAEAMTEVWLHPDTQGALKAMVERVRKKA